MEYNATHITADHLVEGGVPEGIGLFQCMTGAHTELGAGET